jgi:ribosome recycling factor
MLNDVYSQTKAAMDKAVESLEHDLAKLRTGRASTGLVEEVLVEYYGTPTPLQSLALISVPEPQLISIRPYDPGAMKAIEKAILQSDLGLNPNNDGKVIRLQIPRLTEERRRDLSKGVSKRVEEARVSVRNTRRQQLDVLKNAEKSKDISEDEMYNGRDKVQQLTDDYVELIDEIGEAKEKEIMEV